MPKDADRKGGTPFRKEMKAMEPIFEQLENATQRLNTTGDQANELIRAANERLQRLGAGVELWPTTADFTLREETSAPSEDGETSGSSRAHVLGFAKLGTWQLAIRVERYVGNPGSCLGDDYDGEENRHPLLSADREIRIRAAVLLPEFLKAYAERIQKLADQLPNAEE